MMRMHHTFVPETMRADVLLRNMKQQKQYFAVVIDEYGGVTELLHCMT